MTDVKEITKITNTFDYRESCLESTKHSNVRIHSYACNKKNLLI